MDLRGSWGDRARIGRKFGHGKGCYISSSGIWLRAGGLVREGEGDVYCWNCAAI